MNTYLLEEMTWPEISQAMNNGYKTVIIYAASIEQHGPGLPENTDTLLGIKGAVDLAKRLGNALVAPIIRPGLSKHHMCFPGSLTLRPETFKAIVYDYVSCYESHGFDTIVLASSHGGNFKILEELQESLSTKFPNIKIVTGMSLDQLDESLAKLEVIENLPTGTCGGHACDWETSIMLTIGEELVRKEKLEKGHVGPLTDDLLNKFFQDGVNTVSPIGVMGDPTNADKERGERYFEYFQTLQENVIREKLKDIK